MSFLRPIRMTKKRFKFQVTLHLEQLLSVPFVTGTLYCKIRLRDGGNFTANTDRDAVQDHSVVWKSKFQFQCKMSADPSTGVLDPCVLRISVRKEVKGGKSAAKVGRVDLNLAEFAGSNHTSRHCLLEGYQDKIRLDNSVLKIIVGMHLLSGDPCFKVPTVRDTALQLPEDPSQLERGLTTRGDSDSSGFGSLPRKVARSQSPRQQGSGVDVFEQGHSRNSSTTSQQSKLSDYSSRHSRTPSSTSQTSSPGITITNSEQYNSANKDSTLKADSHDAPTSPSASAKTQPPPRPPPPKNVIFRPLDVTQDRMGVTRVSADDIVNKLIQDQDFSHNAGAEEDGLRLYISADGKTALGGQNFHNRAGTSMYHPVFVEASPRPSAHSVSNKPSSKG